MRAGDVHELHQGPYAGEGGGIRMAIQRPEGKAKAADGRIARARRQLIQELLGSKSQVRIVTRDLDRNLVQLAGREPPGAR